MGAVYRGKDKRLGRYEAALRLDPTFAWALKELGEVYDLRARGQGFRGIDASASKNKAVEQFDQALKSSPGFLYPIFAKVVSLLDAANHEAEKLSAQ
jgi:tetratricopeptide (TPR) repeat protein